MGFGYFLAPSPKRLVRLQRSLTVAFPNPDLRRLCFHSHYLTCFSGPAFGVIGNLGDFHEVLSVSAFPRCCLLLHGLQRHDSLCDIPESWQLQSREQDR